MHYGAQSALFLAAHHPSFTHMKAFYTLLTLAALFAGQTLQAQRDDWQRMVDQKRFAEVLALAKSHPDTTDFAALYAAGQAAEGLLKYRDA